MMRSLVIGLGVVMCSASGVGMALAQEGLATSGTIGGHNTVQQAPSGGRVEGGATVGGAASSAAPTPEERQTEKHNNDVTQICKGC